MGWLMAFFTDGSSHLADLLNRAGCVFAAQQLWLYITQKSLILARKKPMTVSCDFDSTFILYLYIHEH